MTNIKNFVNHPQSNGKLDRFHGTIKPEAIRYIPKITFEQRKKEVEEILFYQNESENCLKENKSVKSIH